MAYQALYRKLRPKTFSDVRGQDHIIRTLQNQIVNEHITHAYLFCGTRGTGKTSTAKLFAKAINCFNLQSGEPCNECKSCIEINNQTSMDVLEIDAASNNSVENVRDIVAEVKYTPTISKYKIYIIDEVHMLSIGAFNALLKTLEEPPKHIIFILATTDPQKIPATILSRCQRFDFKRITNEIMVSTLKSYMTLENRDIDDDALRYICNLSDGAMRDALSLLDQCISFYFDETITVDKVLEIVGSVDKNIFNDFITSIIQYDTNECMNIIDTIVINGKDILQFVNDCIQHIRDILIIKATQGENSNINMSKENIVKTYGIYKDISNDTLLGLIKAFSEMTNEIKYSSNKRVILEVNCIKLCTVETKEDYIGLIKRLEMLEKKVSAQPRVVEVVKESSTQQTQQPIKPIKEKAVPDDILKAINEYNLVVSKIKDSLTKSFFKQCKAGYIEGDILNIVANSPASKSIIDKNIDTFKSILTSMYDKDFNIKVDVSRDYDIQHQSEYGVNDDFIYEQLQKDINFDNIEVLNKS